MQLQRWCRPIGRAVTHSSLVPKTTSSRPPLVVSSTRLLIAAAPNTQRLRTLWTKKKTNEKSVAQSAPSSDSPPGATKKEEKLTLREKVTEFMGDVFFDPIFGIGPILTLKLWLLQKGVRFGARKAWARIRGKKDQNKLGLIGRLFRKNQ